MSEQDQWMLMFTLGPVQIWIEQARKARDLWLGSLLLSMLMEAAMAHIHERIVFPAVHTVGKTPDIPNKYVALFPSEHEAEQAAGVSVTGMQKRWEGICQAVFAAVIDGHDDQVTREIWQRQTHFARLFETYWVVTSRPSLDYTQWLMSTEQLLGARKRLRDFQAQDEPGEKSAISGEREVLRRQPRDSEGVKSFWTDVTRDRSPRDIDTMGGERLDAIDVIKRFATLARAGAVSQGQAFPSTSAIATASFVERLLTVAPAASQPEVEQRWRTALSNWQKATEVPSLRKPREAATDLPFLAALRGPASADRQWLLRLDGDLYFPATFAPRRMEKDYALTDGPTIDRGKAALRALLNSARELEIARPTPYYGVIQMDGDRMGKLLGTAHNWEMHRRFSQALSSFAHDVALPLVEDAYPARLIYAGGDDVLAFAPLVRERWEAGQPATILDLVELLQARYVDIVSGVLPQPPQGEEAVEVTASTGIAIAHHYTSLSYALRSARGAEQAAKKRYGRNALVVTLLRRSGEQTQVGCHWRYPHLEPAGQPVQLFTRFYALFKKDSLSPKCVHQLLTEAPALVGLPGQARASEVRRVLLRHLNLLRCSEADKVDLPQEMGALAGYVAALAAAMDEGSEEKSLAVDLHALERRSGLVEVLGWLLVMTFLARKDEDRE